MRNGNEKRGREEETAVTRGRGRGRGRWKWKNAGGIRESGMSSPGLELR